jgi:hypothetical protein
MATLNDTCETDLSRSRLRFSALRARFYAELQSILAGFRCGAQQLATNARRLSLPVPDAIFTNAARHCDVHFRTVQAATRRSQNELF